MKDNTNILDEEIEKLVRALKDEVGKNMLFIFHGRENFTLGAEIPFEFKDPKRGGIKEEGARTERVFDYSLSEIKEALKSSELKMEIRDKKVLKSVSILEELGCIRNINEFQKEFDESYVITEKGYVIAELLCLCLAYPGRYKKAEVKSPQF